MCKMCNAIVHKWELLGVTTGGVKWDNFGRESFFLERLQNRWDPLHKIKQNI